MCVFLNWIRTRTYVRTHAVFPYRSGANNLVAVKKADYDTCGEEEVIHMYFLGPTILNLTEAGDYYYFDGIGKHCEAGQKLHIQVGSKEGTSGSDPMPFNLETFGIHTSLDPALPPPAAAPAATATQPSNANPNALLFLAPIFSPIIAFFLFFSTFLWSSYIMPSLCLCLSLSLSLCLCLFNVYYYYYSKFIFSFLCFPTFKISTIIHSWDSSFISYSLIFLIQNRICLENKGGGGLLIIITFFSESISLFLGRKYYEYPMCCSSCIKLLIVSICVSGFRYSFLACILLSFMYFLNK